MIHHDEIREHIGSLHGTPLCELGELVLPVEESLAEVVPADEGRAEDDLPEICQSTECGVRLKPLIEKSQDFEAVALSLRHDHPIQTATLKRCLKIAMKFKTHFDCRLC